MADKKEDKYMSNNKNKQEDLGYMDKYPLSCYYNRELSWLKFNERVLEEANDETNNPLCERLSFAAIFQSNLDEFFMVRVGSLYDQLEKNTRENKTGMTAQEQFDTILKQVKSATKVKDKTYKNLMSELKDYDVEVVPFSKLNEQETKSMEFYFINEILPLLSPQIVAEKQPFPFLDGRNIYVIAILKTKNSNLRLGIIPCSNRVLRRLVPVDSQKKRYILIENLILHFTPLIFEHYRITDKGLIRILRNADISVDDGLQDFEHSLDYRTKMEKMIITRRKLSPVKLEYYGDISEDSISDICKHLKISKKQSFSSRAPLDLSFLYQIQDVLRENKALFYPRRVPQASKYVVPNKSILRQIENNDLLLAYPYESIKPFISMLQEAGNDPSVMSIKMTLYRVAKNSSIIDALCQAAENGKDVHVLVELRARFDEENNISWSRVLEDAGCKVIYGIEGIKIHSKICVITRKVDNKISYISQIGTGNYNEKTAKLYTDFSLMTADYEIGNEISNVFNCLGKGELVTSTKYLLVAPYCLQNKLCDLIDEQIALAKAGDSGAYIGIKCNSVTDKILMDKLIEASQAGVKIQMVVRGICCLVSGIPNYTENIQIISIVGRYLEHARIYRFGKGKSEKLYIASADLMTRNTTKRVEVAVPVLNPDIRQRIGEMFDLMMKDNVKARIQLSDGTYQSRFSKDNEVDINSQELFFENAYKLSQSKLEYKEQKTSKLLSHKSKLLKSSK